MEHILIGWPNKNRLRIASEDKRGANKKATTITHPAVSATLRLLHHRHILLALGIRIQVDEALNHEHGATDDERIREEQRHRKPTYQNQSKNDQYSVLASLCTGSVRAQNPKSQNMNIFRFVDIQLSPNRKPVEIHCIFSKAFIKFITQEL